MIRSVHKSIKIEHVHYVVNKSTAIMYTSFAYMRQKPIGTLIMTSPVTVNK